jgi:hypothetical protein
MIIVLSSISCGKKKTQYIILPTNQSNAVCEIDSSLEFKLVYDNIESIPQYLFFRGNNNELVYFNYSENNKNWVIEKIIFDSVAHRLIIGEIPALGEMGIGGPDVISDILYINADTIFAIGINNLFLFSLRDSTIQKHRLNSSDFKYFYRSSDIYDAMKFENKRLYFSSYYKAGKNSKSEKYDSSIVSYFDFKTKTIKNPPVYSSLLLLDDSRFYGALAMKYWDLSIDGNKIVYGFKADPNIYTYDFNKNEQKVHGGKSKYFDTIPDFLDYKEKEDIEKQRVHFLTQPWQSCILADKYRGLYYKIFSLSMNEKSNKGTYNELQDKQSVLMIFDENFKLISEIDLGTNYQTWFSFVLSDGLYIVKEKRFDDEIEYKRFAINVK